MLFKRKLKEDPLGAMDSMGGMNDVLFRAFKQAAEELVRGKDFIEAVAELAYSRIPRPKDGKHGSHGKDGKDGRNADDIDFIVSKVTPLIPRARDGIDGKNGRDGKDGKQGLRGETGFPGRDGRDITDVDGKELVQSINNLPLEKDKMIDAKHIKGLTEEKAKGTDLFRGGLKLIWSTVLDGTVNGVNAVFTVPAELPDPKDDRFIVSVRGVLKTADNGDFTATNANRTITFTNAPPNGSDSPRIVIYHGK